MQFHYYKITTESSELFPQTTLYRDTSELTNKYKDNLFHVFINTEPIGQVLSF